MGLIKVGGIYSISTVHSTSTVAVIRPDWISNGWKAATYRTLATRVSFDTARTLGATPARIPRTALLIRLKSRKMGVIFLPTCGKLPSPADVSPFAGSASSDKSTLLPSVTRLRITVPIYPDLHMHLINGITYQNFVSRVYIETLMYTQSHPLRTALMGHLRQRRRRFTRTLHLLQVPRPHSQGPTSSQPYITLPTKTHT